MCVCVGGVVLFVLLLLFVVVLLLLLLFIDVGCGVFCFVLAFGVFM